MTEYQQNESAVDGDIKQLMAIAGRRDQPPAEMEARVREAVMQAFDELPAHSSLRHRGMLAAAAAVVLALVTAVVLVNNPSVPASAGEIQFSTGSFSLHQPDGMVAGTDLILPGATLQTDRDGRVLVRLGRQLFVRADADTRFTLDSPTDLLLHHGRIYVDSSSSEQLTVRTRHAIITDIGTLFEVSADNEQLTVAIREGIVDVQINEQRLQSRAEGGRGELLRFTGENLSERTRIAASDGHWRWIQQARPGFKLAGSSVADYLEWAARESGLQLRYQSDLVRQQAQMPQALQGNAVVEADVDSIRQVLRTTRFDVADLSGEELIVRFAAM